MLHVRRWDNSIKPRLPFGPVFLTVHTSPLIAIDGACMRWFGPGPLGGLRALFPPAEAAEKSLRDPGNAEETQSGNPSAMARN
jgi:hypothetical protein